MAAAVGKRSVAAMTARRRRNPVALRAWGILVALLAVLVAAGLRADAQVRIDAYREGTSSLAPGAQVDVPARIPFHLLADGMFYAKLLETPSNPVNNGRPNGTVREDHSAGVSGWWIQFELAAQDGTPLTSDGEGNAIDPVLGFFVDSTATPLVRLAGNASYLLVAVIHVPEDGATGGASYRVPVALAFRNEASAGGATSGAHMDDSRGFTQELVFVRAPPGGRGETPVGSTGWAVSPERWLWVLAGLGTVTAIMSIVAVAMLASRSRRLRGGREPPSNLG